MRRIAAFPMWRDVCVPVHIVFECVQHGDRKCSKENGVSVFGSRHINIFLSSFFASLFSFFNIDAHRFSLRSLLRSGALLLSLCCWASAPVLASRTCSEMRKWVGGRIQCTTSVLSINKPSVGSQSIQSWAKYFNMRTAEEDGKKTKRKEMGEDVDEEHAVKRKAEEWDVNG